MQGLPSDFKFHIVRKNDDDICLDCSASGTIESSPISDPNWSITQDPRSMIVYIQHVKTKLWLKGVSVIEDGKESRKLSLVKQKSDAEWTIRLDVDEGLVELVPVPCKGEKFMVGRALLIAGGVGLGCVCFPYIAVSAISSIGFTTTGITGGSLASAMMSSAAVAQGGGVAAGTLVPALQAIGATGSLGVVNGAVVSGVGAVTCGTAAAHVPIKTKEAEKAIIDGAWKFAKLYVTVGKDKAYVAGLEILKNFAQKQMM